MGKKKQPKKKVEKVKNDTKMTVLIAILTVISLILTIINPAITIVDKLIK